MEAAPGFSALADKLCLPRESSTTPVRLTSPDGSNTIQATRAREGFWSWTIVRGKKSQTLSLASWACPEFRWSSDSTAFFANYSDGGAVGEWNMSVHRWENGHWHEIDITQAVRGDFKRSYPKCFEPEDPNLAGVAWWKGSSRLLVAAEVLPHSNCDAMGTFALYAVLVPSGRILNKYPQLQAKKRFLNLLGSELRNANDDCIRKPSSCFIPALHSGALGVQ